MRDRSCLAPRRVARAAAAVVARSGLLVALALIVPAAGAPAAAQDLVTFGRDAIKALPSTTSPLKITSLPLLQPGGEVVAIRVSLPAGTDIAPHPHPGGKTAVVTVLSGDFQIGLGTVFSEAALKRVAPGEMIVLRYRPASLRAHRQRAGRAAAGRSAERSRLARIARRKIARSAARSPGRPSPSPLPRQAEWRIIENDSH